MIEPDEQLRDALRDLIPGYTGPTDPLPRVVASVRRRRARQRALLTAGGAGLAAAAVLAAPAMLASTTGGTVQAGVQPAPVVSGPPAPDPRMHPVAAGTVGGAAWSTGSVGIGPGARRCLSSDDELATGEVLCFDAWKGAGASWAAVPSSPGAVRATRVVGVAGRDAAAVRVRFADGDAVTAWAVGTPTDPAVRFFALAAAGTRTVRSVTLLTAAGRPIGAPVTDPGTDPCHPGPDSACAAPK